MSETFNTGIHLDIYEQMWFKLTMMIYTTEFYILIIVIDFDLDSRLNCCEKQKLLL